MAKKELYVRIRPRKNKAPRVYTIRGIKIQEARGWHRVDAALGEYLRTVRSNHGDETSALMFDVCTPAEAESLDKADLRAARAKERAPARHPIDATSGRGAVMPKHEPDETPDLSHADLARGTSRAGKGRPTRARSMRPAADTEA